MTDHQSREMIAALKDISTNLKIINRNVNYLGRKLEMIDSTLENARHDRNTTPDTKTTEEDYGEKIADEIIEKCF